MIFCVASAHVPSMFLLCVKEWKGRIRFAYLPESQLGKSASYRSTSETLKPIMHTLPLFLRLLMFATVLQVHAVRALRAHGETVPQKGTRHF